MNPQQLVIQLATGYIRRLGGFGVLFTLAIRQVRSPENHRRLVLFATESARGTKKE